MPTAGNQGRLLQRRSGRLPAPLRAVSGGSADPRRRWRRVGCARRSAHHCRPPGPLVPGPSQCRDLSSKERLNDMQPRDRAPSTPASAQGAQPCGGTFRQPCRWPGPALRLPGRGSPSLRSAAPRGRQHTPQPASPAGRWWRPPQLPGRQHRPAPRQGCLHVAISARRGRRISRCRGPRTPAVTCTWPPRIAAPGSDRRGPTPLDSGPRRQHGSASGAPAPSSRISWWISDSSSRPSRHE